MSTVRSIVVISPGGGHAERLLPVVAAFACRGFDVHVMTRAGVRSHVEAAGGIFHDLYGRYSVDAADAESMPLPVRLVAFAAAYATPLTGEIARLRPSLLVYDSFAVVAPLIGRRLAIPYVGMRAGHAQAPAQAVAEMSGDPRVVISAACRSAVETLRARHGLLDASPFSYLEGLSPHLNIYPEPPQFLDPGIRRQLEPVAFFGSLAPGVRDARSDERPFAGDRGRTRVCVSFGTAVWRYYSDVAIAAMTVLSDVLSRKDVDALISLGNHQVDASVVGQLERPNVRVETYIDQWAALKAADLFVTHHGLNSTHEAVYHQVPMLSYPFLGDQPSMARRCQELGLALPLTSALRGPLDGETVERQIEQAVSAHPACRARFAEARQWEVETIEGREAVIDQMLALTSESVRREVGWR